MKFHIKIKLKKRLGLLFIFASLVSAQKFAYAQVAIAGIDVEVSRSTGTKSFDFSVNPDKSDWTYEVGEQANDTVRIDKFTIAGDTYHVKWLVKEDFDNKDWKKKWVLEATEADVEVKDGKLFITDYGIGATLWYKDEFPKDIVVRYSARAEKGMPNNKLNFNLITHARENDDSILKIGTEAKRNGAYVQYHQFPNYLSTLTFKHSRLRKNPDFNLLSNSGVSSVENQIYHFVHTIQQGHIRYYLNGTKIHDFKDADPLNGGLFALRTWNTKAWWDNIEIGVLIKK